MIAIVLALAVLGSGAIFWCMKKAGIKPTGSFQKYFYDNMTCTRDTRTGNHRRWHYSKKGSKRSIAVTQTRGLLELEFYTEDGEVIKHWRTGDAPEFELDLPPGKKVYQRWRMTHFSGSVTFR